MNQRGCCAHGEFVDRVLQGVKQDGRGRAVMGSEAPSAATGPPNGRSIRGLAMPSRLLSGRRLLQEGPGNQPQAMP